MTAGGMLSALPATRSEVHAMSIVRVGLAETRNYGDGWDAVFSKKKAGKSSKASTGKKKARQSQSKKKR
jgi:hypothetical protein